jgi:hypothetical protein
LDPTGLAKPGESRGLTGTGPRLARQESEGLELNRPVFAVQTQTAGGVPGPVASTRYGSLAATTATSD